MKKIKIILSILFLTQSYIAQSQIEKDILGNWQIQKHIEYEVIYQEIYISDSTMYIYDMNLGINPVGTYQIKKSTLFLAQLDSSFEKIGKIHFTGPDLLNVEKDGITVKYRKLKGKKLLQHLIEEKIDKNQYSIKFSQRLNKWQKKN
ncbi:hypothetical protein [Flagellimonas marinaquae]|jgi:hypothetical protein